MSYVLYHMLYLLSYVLRTISNVLCLMSYVICPVSYVIHSMSYVLCKMSYVLCQMSCVIYSVNYVACHMLKMTLLTPPGPPGGWVNGGGDPPKMCVRTNSPHQCQYNLPRNSKYLKVLKMAILTPPQDPQRGWVREGDPRGTPPPPNGCKGYSW